jgi:thermitase
MDKRKNKALWIMLLVISIFLTTAVYGAPVSADAGSPASYLPDRIVVKFKEGLSSAHVAQLHASQGTTVVDEIPRIGVQILSVPPGEVEAKIAAFRADPGVEYAEPDYIAQPTYEPNDPYYGDGTQWGPQKIFAPQAWDFCKGDSNVAVAVIDWGVDLQHPDLATEMWTNPSEIPDNGFDDDGNGYIDDVYGWDFAYNDNDPRQDDYGHGSHVAGIAAAATDNGVGIAGVAFNSSVMAVKVGYTDPESGKHLARYTDIAYGIMYAADNGAKVINLSLGGYGYSLGLKGAVNYAWDAGCVLVGAVGNNNKSDPLYPAAYDNVIGVSATDQNDAKASWSNYGVHVAVAAPGSSIYSTYWNDGSTYAHMSGTSMAAPHVAGLAALLFAQDDTRTNAAVRSVIEGSADDLGDAGWDQYYGYGRINAYKALHTTSAVIEPEAGGSLSADDGNLTLDFPAWSVTSTTTVTYTPNASPSNPTGDLIFANMDCVLEATDGQGDPVTQFDPPYTLTLLYQDSDWQSAGITSESTLNLYYWNGSRWEAVLPCAGCSLNTANHELVAVLGHFSEFGLMGEGAEPTRVSLSSFVARSGGAAQTHNKVASFGGLVFVGLTVIAFGANSPARARLRKR